MIVIEGNKSKEISQNQLEQLIIQYHKTILDIGTGDGRFVLESAKKEPKKIYIGIDPVESQLKIYSKKAVRNKLNNAVFVVGSLENFPPEIQNQTIDHIYVILPWGSLLKSVVFVDNHMKKLLEKLKLRADLTLVLGYDLDSEPTETTRLELPPLDETTIMTIINAYEKIGLTLIKKQKLTKSSLRKHYTSWSKKLSFGKDRAIYKLDFTFLP